MKPVILYAMPAAKTICSVIEGVPYLRGAIFDHIPEMPWDMDGNNFYDSDRVEIRIIKEHYFDHCRLWRLATVWFDGQPVMVIQNAGREGGDWSKRVITDTRRYKAMIEHLNSLWVADDLNANCVASEDDDIPKLAEFYAYSIKTVGME